MRSCRKTSNFLASKPSSRLEVCCLIIESTKKNLVFDRLSAKKKISTEGVENISKMEETFDLIDYAVFALMLIVCLAIGLYFGYKHSVKKNANATLDYLLGGKNVQLFPGKIKIFAVSKYQKLL